MDSQSFISSIFWLFTGAALLEAFDPEPTYIVSAYIILNMLLGPSGLQVVPLDRAGAFISFLIFLYALDLMPRELLSTLHKASLVTLVFSILFISLGFAVGHYFTFTFVESLSIGASLIFSSTLIGLKLLPSLALHHRPIGETMVNMLLLHALLAVVLLLVYWMEMVILALFSVLGTVFRIRR